MSSRINATAMALFAVIALGSFTAAVAQAAEGPSITVEPKAKETKRLGTNETRNFTVKAFSMFRLKDSTIGYSGECTILEAKPAVQLGAAAGNDPLSDVILKFTGCSAKQGTASCGLASITTKALKDELVEATDKTTGLTLIKPETGKVITEFTQTGTGCSSPIKVEGELLAEGYFDEEGTKGVAVTLSTPKLPKKSWILKTLTEPPAHVIKFSGGTETETAVKGLEVLGTPAELAGEGLVLLVSGENWSPLA